MEQVAEACAYRTSLINARDAFADSIWSQGFSESVLQIRGP